MVYIFLPKNKEYISNRFVLEFLEKYIKHSYEYKVLWVKRHLKDVDVPILGDNDIAIWHPAVANYNIHIVSTFTSVVILERETLFLQKISKFNPINENMAIAHGFYVHYIDDETDITNDEWKLVIKKEDYYIAFTEIVNILNPK